MNVIAVTGTNGKTTVVYWVYQMLGELAAYIGTLGAKTFDMSDFETTGFTTPDDVGLLPWLKRFNQRGCEHLAIEASSHGLKQNRLKSLKINIGVFLNLTRDHLDYHKDMDDYFNSKALLFTANDLQSAIINVDDEYGRKLVGLLSDTNLITFSCNGEADVMLQSCTSDSANNSWKIEVTCKSQPLVLSLSKNTFIATAFNLSNLLAVIGVAYSVGFSTEQIVEKLSAITMPKGRLQPVDCGQNFKVFVDYAHAPDAIENVLSNLDTIKENRLIVVLGCGGDRDKGKRPLMAQAGVRYADIAIFTSDNPRSESPDEIISDMLAGVSSNKVVVEADRKLAIQRGLAMAEQGDIVLIAGKGHETTQEIKGVYYPFDDVAIASEYLYEEAI